MCAAQKCQPDSRAPMFAAAEKWYRSEMLMEHYGDVLNGLVKVTATAPRQRRALHASLALLLRPLLALLLRPLYILPCFPAIRRLSPQTKLLPRHVCTTLAVFAALSLLAQAEFFESGAPYFIGQLSKARTSPHFCFASSFVASFLIFLFLPHTSRSLPSFPPARQRKWRPFHLRDHRG